MKTKKESTNARKLLVNYLTSTYPHLWQSTVPDVIKNVGLIDINFLIEKIEEGIKHLEIKSEKRICIHAPVSSYSERFVDGVVGHKSQKYYTVEVSINGKSYFIKYSNGSSLNGFSTLTKESLFVYFANNRIRYTKFKMTCNPRFIEMYHRLLQTLIRDISKQGIKGISTDDTQEVLMELNNELLNTYIDPNRAMLKTIFNAMSGGNSIAKKLPVGYSLYRNDYFNEIREFIGYLNNTRKIDNFCPMDVVAIRDNFVDKLVGKLNHIKTYNFDVQKKLFNVICADSKTISSSEKPIWCISLKQEVAAGGKGKSAIGKGGNLTKEQQALLIEEQVKQIESIRIKISLMNNENFKFVVLGDMGKLISKNTLINKLSALTLLDYILSHGSSYKDLIEKTVSMCAGLGSNPPFTKMILNEKGDEKNVKYLDYSEDYTIKISPYHPIEIIDKNSSNSIDIIFFIEDIDSKTGKSKTSKAKIELRTSGLSIQSVVELKYL